MAVKCGTMDPKKANEIGSELKKVTRQWQADGKIQSATDGNWKHFKDLYYEHTGNDFDFGGLPTLEQVRVLGKQITKLSKKIVKHPTPFGTYLKLPEAVLRKFPVGKEFFDAVHIASNHYRGSSQIYKSTLDEIVRNLDQAMKLSGVASRFGLTTSKASKKLAKLEATHNKMIADKDLAGAEVFWNDNLKDLRKDKELAVYEHFHRLVTTPSSIYTAKSLKNHPKDSAKWEIDTKLTEAYSPALVDAARKWHSMSEGLWTELKHGLDFYASVMKDNVHNYSSLKDLYKKIDILKDIEYQENYFPTQVLDIFPTLSKVTEDIYSGRANQNAKSLTKYVDDLITDVQKNLKVPGSSFERRYEPARKISKNVPQVLDNYVKSITRFNYTSKVTAELTKALKKLRKMQGTESEKAAGYYGKYIEDMHNTVLGLGIKNSKLGWFARMMTSYQFSSKLGLNVRTVARNATQSLQNYTYFGAFALKDALAYGKDEDFKRFLNEELKLHGIKFVNIEELAVQHNLLPKVREVDGKIVEDVASVGDYLAQGMESLAKKTGWGMQLIENKLNREVTFRIAYTQHHNMLLNDPTIIRKAVQKANPQKKNIEDLVKQEIVSRSGRFAANMVKELHYLYDPWAKPKLIQGPLGSVFGQFSTYSINFFEFQRKIAAGGLRDVGRGIKSAARLKKPVELLSPEAWRLYRLGMLYTFINGILSPFTGIDFSMLVENDTLNSLGQMYTYLSNPEEEDYVSILRKRKMDFGDPFAEGEAKRSMGSKVADILATELGGPTVSDIRKVFNKFNTEDGVGEILQLGTLFGIDKMAQSEAQRAAYLMNYQDEYDKNPNDAIAEVLSFLNNQLFRTYKYSFPRFTGGSHLSTITAQELGLYQTPKMKKKQIALFDAINNNAPNIIAKHFPKAKKKKRKGSDAWENYWNPGSKESYYNNEEMQEILKSLNAVQSYEE
jgi:hypothetical protein